MLLSIFLQCIKCWVHLYLPCFNFTHHNFTLSNGRNRKHSTTSCVMTVFTSVITFMRNLKVDKKRRIYPQFVKKNDSIISDQDLSWWHVPI